MNTSVAIVLYNRPHNTNKLINKLNKFKLNKVYIISDGPKKNYKNDFNLVKTTRTIVDKKLKAKKKIKIYSNKNLGLRKRIITGLDKVFKYEEKAIILEDDCIPSEEFFLFVNKMLKRFEKDKKIASILGSNYLSKWKTRNKYLISKYFHPWGWATWSDRWLKKEMDPKNLLKIKYNKQLIKYLGSFRALLFWFIKIWQIKKNKKNSWAYTWMYYNFIYTKKHIVPKFNLIDNIGMGENSSNTKVLPYEYFGYTKIIKSKKIYNRLNKFNKNNFDEEIENIVFSKNMKNRIVWFLFKLGLGKEIKLL
jgi:hypothetical protein